MLRAGGQLEGIAMPLEQLKFARQMRQPRTALRLWGLLLALPAYFLIGHGLHLGAERLGQ